MLTVKESKNGQAMPIGVERIGKDAFEKKEHTEIRWLGGGGAMVNSRGTVLMLDPVLRGFDMPLLFEAPIRPEEVPRLDGVLITHTDNDHCSLETCKALLPVCGSYHGPGYVAEYMRENGLPGEEHDIGESFSIGGVTVKPTPAKHDWPNDDPNRTREWKESDFCGYWLDTPDGSVWMVGDSKLLNAQLDMPQPDVILFDFSDNGWHITFEGAVKLANAYPGAQLICIHWGTVDAPDFDPFNGDPRKLTDRVVNPERIRVLKPGEAYQLSAGPGRIGI